MILLFKLIVLTYIVCMGWKIATSRGMLLEGIGEWGERMVDSGYKLFDLIVCPWCIATTMSIVAHGFAFGLGILPFEWDVKLIIRWPLVVMGTSLLSGMTWTIYETINQIKDRNIREVDFYEETNN